MNDFLRAIIFFLLLDDDEEKAVRAPTRMKTRSTLLRLK